MVTEHLLITVTSCIVPTMRENRFLLFLNHLRLPYSIPKSFALLLSFHTSRHTCATMLLTLGADIYTTSKLLGHANVNTTAIYAKIVDQKKVETVNLVDDFFSIYYGELHIIYLMRIQELRELSFYPYMPLVYPTFF